MTQFPKQNIKFVNYLNRKQDFKVYEDNICPKGRREDNVIHVVDGVEYKSLDQYELCAKHARNLFKTGKQRKSPDIDVITKVLDDNSLEIEYCMAVAIDLDIGIYDASKVIDVCGQSIYSFDDDMELIMIEHKTRRNMGGQLFQYILQSTLTTILPEDGNYIDRNDLMDEDKNLFSELSYY